MIHISCIQIQEIRGGRWVNRKSCHFEIFNLYFLDQNTVKILSLIFRQSCPKSFFGFTLKGKDALRTRLVVREVRQCPDGRCNEVLPIMFETTFFGHWVKHHLQRLILQPHWSSLPPNVFIVRTVSLELILHEDDDYGQHSWDSSSSFIKICQCNFTFLGQEEQRGSWKWESAKKIHCKLQVQLLFFWLGLIKN